MRSKRSRSISYHLVTPEEPIRGKHHVDKTKDDLESRDGDKLDSTAVSDCEASFFMPSIRNTRSLESEILDMINLLQEKSTDADKARDNERMISLLNRSITAISHWSLQAQLVQLRSNVDDRQVVENNLLRREMELLINRRSVVDVSERKCAKQPSRLASKAVYLRSPPYVSGVSESSSPKRSSRKHMMLASPTSNTLGDPVSLKLVENNKPHPRMKRNSDNPSTNEYVRVFHLQRE